MRSTAALKLFFLALHVMFHIVEQTKKKGVRPGCGLPNYVFALTDLSRASSQVYGAAASIPEHLAWLFFAVDETLVYERRCMTASTQQ